MPLGAEDSSEGGVTKGVLVCGCESKIITSGVVNGDAALSKDDAEK